jgi:hypothetical protein
MSGRSDNVALQYHSRKSSKIYSSIIIALTSESTNGLLLPPFCLKFSNKVSLESKVLLEVVSFFALQCNFRQFPKAIEPTYNF